MLVGISKETAPGERRVSFVPADIPRLTKVGLQVVIEPECGVAAGYPDSEYIARGASVASDRDDLFRRADILTQVRGLGANPESPQDLGRSRPGQLLVAMCDPLGQPGAIAEFAASGARLLALEMIPRITRAQSMDVLSSMATVAGYRAVLNAASVSPRMFPMLMTAAGTVSAARVFVIGAGVAGLQAIATSRRLGAIVHSYDVRPACREQCESLGAKFVELQLEAGESEDQGGYAKAMGEEFYVKQRELMASVVAESEIVITTAAIPGKPSPLLITRAAVEGMAPGGVIVDLAAERGGNCELSQPDQRVEHHGVTILGPTNLPSEAPLHASQMFSRNVATLLAHVVADGHFKLDVNDPIVADTLVAAEGEVRHPRLRELLQLPQLPPAAAPTDSSATESEASTEASEPSNPPKAEESAE